ncbi:ATP-binding protein [Trichloromonas sp.]|uniref:ATP-binding protein n=1 Tax=Trichloromonas sp. TaxID=3069249 RepID=UPI003D81900A
MTARPLRQILFLQSALVAVVPFLIAGLLVVLWLLPQINLELESRQSQLASSIAAKVDSYLVSPMRHAIGIASLLKNQRLEPRELQNVLDAHVEISPSIEALYVTGEDGRIVAVGLAEKERSRRQDLVGLDLSQNRLFQLAVRERKPAWSDVFLSLISGKLSVAFAIPTEEMVVIGEVDLGRVTIFLRQIAIDGEQLILVIDRHGQIVADQDGDYTAQQLNISNLPLVKEALSAQGSVYGRFEFEGLSMLGSLTHVPALDWHVFVAQPSEMAYHAVWTALRITLAGLLSALLIAVLIAFYLSRRMAGAFEGLILHARQVTAGEEDVAWPQANIGEFQELSASLQLMSESIRERERQLSTLMSNLPGMAYRCSADAQRRFLFVSEGCQELVGCSDREILDGRWAGFDALVHAEDLPAVKAWVETGLQLKQPYQMEYRILDARGICRWVLDHGRGVWDKNGQLLCIEGLITDVTARRFAEEALKRTLADAEEAKDKVELVLRSVVDGLVFTDMQGRIVLMSASAETLLDVTQQEAWGVTLDSVVENRAIQGHFSELQEGGREAAVLELAYVNKKDGREMNIQVISALVKKRDGEAAGVITLLRDVSQERELDRMKSEFISTAAHELRTPLTVILGFSEVLLAENDLVEHQREYLSIIVDKAEVLQRLIDDLLDLGRVDSGRLVHVEKDRCDIGELVQRAVADARMTSGDHRYEVVLPDAAVEIEADCLRIAQVLENLLGNAIKFSPAGSLVRVICRAAADADTIQLSVADQGAGMSAEQVARVFDKFYRADSSSTSKQGLGLGMTIVKNIIDAHGGQIRVESEPGRGTEVLIELPVSGKDDDLPWPVQGDRR